jgi:hypothetical protein
MTLEDAMDTAFWQQQWNAFLAAPVVSLFFLAIGASAAWWFRGMTSSGATDGLREHIAVLEERLQLAGDKVAARDDAMDKLKGEIKQLQDKIDAQAPWQEIAARSGMLKKSLENLYDLDVDLNATLQFEDPADKKFSDWWENEGREKLKLHRPSSVASDQSGALSKPE